MLYKTLPETGERRTLTRDMRPLFLPGGDEPLASLSAMLNASLGAEISELRRGMELSELPSVVPGRASIL